MPERSSRTRRDADFGHKLSTWLARNRAAGLAPSSAAALARTLGVSHTAVNKWVKGEAVPRVFAVVALASLSGYRLEDWTNDGRSLPTRPSADALDSLLRMIPEAERAALVSILSDPVERRAIIAAWRARVGGRRS